MWLKSLKQHFTKKRTQQEAATSSLTGDEDAAELVTPATAEDEEYNSRPKRRSVSIDVTAPRFESRNIDRRTSLEQWHEARRARNSMEGQGTTTTGRLTVCKAGTTTIVNKTYITIKHLGSGTFGRVMLAYNVYDQRLYAIKVCRKSQFVQFSSGSRYSHASRLRRGGQQVHSSSYNNLQSPSSASGHSFTAQRCGVAAAAVAAGQAAHSYSGPLPPANNATSSSCGGTGGGGLVMQINATSTAADVTAAAAASAAAAAAAAAASMLGSGSGTASAGGCGYAAFGFGTATSVRPGGGWPTLCQPPQQQQQAGWCKQGQLMPPIQTQQELPLLPLSSSDMAQLSALGGGAKVPPPPRTSPNAALDALQLQRGGSRRNSFGPGGCGAAAAAAAGSAAAAGALLSSSSTGWGGGGGGGCGGAGGLMGTDCSTGSLSQGNSSVFQEALMRFQTEEVVKEIAILKKLHHPNIVNLVEVIDDPNTDSLLLVMEYVEGGTLEAPRLGSARWQPLPEKDVWRYVRDVLQGLDYLHSHKVVHGDLKPANLLQDANSARVKIADFGSSSILAGSDKLLFSMRNCPGFSTPAFRSPESLTSGYTPSYEMDLWALGVCVYMWVYGVLPFTGGAPFIIYEKIRGQDVMQPNSAEVSPELRDFISQLLDKDVMQRLDVTAAMQHPWVTLGGSAPLASCRQHDAEQQQQQQGDIGSGSSGCLGLDVSQEDIDAAIRQIGSSMSELMDVVFEEVSLQAGQELIAAGEVADRMFLIARGEVEILQAPHAAGRAEPLVSGLEVDLLGPDATDADMWDSTQVSDISKSPGTSSMMLLGDVVAPWDSSSSHAAAAQPPVKVLAVKGPGDSLGVPLVPGSSSSGSSRRSHDRRWKVSVRARSDVKLFRARLDDLARLAEAHPEMESAVKQIVTQQETDMMVAEAMRQLRLYGDCAGRHTHVPDVVMAAS